MIDRTTILVALAATVIVAGCRDAAGPEGDVGSVSSAYIKVFALADGDQFFLDGDVTDPGTYPLAEERRDGTFYGELALDVSHSQNTARAIYVLTSGTVTLDPPGEQAGRIRGRFAGAARLLTGTATIQITDGAFDVPDNLPRPVD